jgi:hypothetical protein
VGRVNVHPVDNRIESVFEVIPYVVEVLTLFDKLDALRLVVDSLQEPTASDSIAYAA